MSGIVPVVPCATCAAPIRRATSLPICRDCMKLAERVFEREHPYTNPDVWVRNRNRVFGSVAKVVALIEAERGVLAGAS